MGLLILLGIGCLLYFGGWFIIPFLIILFERPKAKNNYNPEVVEVLERLKVDLHNLDNKYNDRSFNTERYKPPAIEHTFGHYAVLRIKPGCSADELKAAYRREAMLWHPDKLDRLAPELKAHAERQMAAINQAYQSLQKEIENGNSDRDY